MPLQAWRPGVTLPEVGAGERAGRARGAAGGTGERAGEQKFSMLIHCFAAAGTMSTCHAHLSFVFLAAVTTRT